ncbi:RloB family protein [Pedobacter sp. AW31-3R]|uniref:RloB family protein n=1 Tax=Pedobacter sp. AW31-3R TaxID=3445781 RepID=UPI003FA0B454
MAKRGKIQGFEITHDINRPLRIKKYKYFYLIVCEDENTERVYFQGFEIRIPKETLYLDAVGTGLDPLGIVTRAISEKKRLEALCERSVDEVWVVFDKDDADLNDTRITRFQAAFKLAAEQGFKIAYSNEVFELWLLLHLSDVDPEIPIGRQEVYTRLESEIRQREGHEDFLYEHGDEAVLKVIAEIGDEQAALQRAEQLIAFHEGKEPIISNPVTFVGKLILDLYSWIEYYSYQE